MRTATALSLSLVLALASLACQAQEPAPSVTQAAPAADATVVPAAPAAPATPTIPAGPTHQQIEATIREQTTRRSGAITGIVMGAIVVFGGIVVTAVQTVNEADDKAARGDTSDTPYNYNGTLVGLAIAAPIIWVSATTFADAQKQIRHARRQRRLNVGFATEPGRERLTLAFAFGD